MFWYFFGHFSQFRPFLTYFAYYLSYGVYFCYFGFLSFLTYLKLKVLIYGNSIPRRPIITIVLYLHFSYVKGIKTDGGDIIFIFDWGAQNLTIILGVHKTLNRI